MVKLGMGIAAAQWERGIAAGRWAGAEHIPELTGVALDRTGMVARRPKVRCLRAVWGSG